MLDQTPVWKTLQKHCNTMTSKRMPDLFVEDKARFELFSLEACDLFLDYSKNRIVPETMDQLLKLAEFVALKDKMRDLFSGKLVNFTENRAALHVALRDMSDSHGVSGQVKQALSKMEDIVQKIRSGSWLGYSGKPIKDIVNIGIGGSDLGPRMVVDALAAYREKNLSFHFISNVDGFDLYQLFEKLNPETTLFILSSKSFATQETLCHAKASVKGWLLEHAQNQAGVLEKHCIAVTANVESARAFGVSEQNILPLWDWVGGRYSVWSCIGLPIALSIGMDQFKDFLKGAFEMDQHFKDAPFDQNMPVILALLGIWYANFFNAHTQAILPYVQSLRYFPNYLQQLAMESNGKSVNQAGQVVSYMTSPVVWGGVGTDVQHSFLQLLHQGTHLIPVDFIATIESQHDLKEHHQLLLANCFAQSQALMKGRLAFELREETESLKLHKVIAGNKPSNTILIRDLTPKTLGSLIALYEHKTVAQGMIWGINSFDQWGVELGKQLVESILNSDEQDASTQGLMDYMRNLLKD